MGNGDERRADASETVCERVEDPSQTSTRIWSCRNRRCEVARSRADSETHGEDDFAVQRENDE